jgi:membrane fusion protein (multidrug efflux system)
MKDIMSLVNAGALMNGAWVVLSGLQGDEQVIVNGLQKVRPGSSVTAVPAGSQPANIPAGGK